MTAIKQPRDLWVIINKVNEDDVAEAFVCTKEPAHGAIKHLATHFREVLSPDPHDFSTRAENERIWAEFMQWRDQQLLIASKDPDREKAARAYAESCDNESGSFLSHHLKAIRAKAYLAGADALGKELAEAKEQLLVPGNFKCPKCNCGVVARNLYMKSGNIGPSDKPQICPNECGPMWGVTWKDRAIGLSKSCEKLRWELADKKRKNLELSDLIHAEDGYIASQDDLLKQLAESYEFIEKSEKLKIAMSALEIISHSVEGHAELTKEGVLAREALEKIKGSV